MRKGESGQTIIFFAVGLALLVTIVAVVTNLGYTTTARTEAHQAAGQAALAAATAFNECPKSADSIAARVKDRAREVARLNTIAGDPVALADEDITLGWMHPLWETFTPLSSSEYHVANSVRVHAKSTPIPLFLSKLLGGQKTTERTSTAWSVLDGPGVQNTGICLALNDCGVLNAFGGPGQTPVDYNIHIRYDRASTETGQFWSLSFLPDPGALAVCPPPTTFPPQFPSPDDQCAIEWLIAHAHVFGNLFCLGNPSPPELCSTWVGNFIGNPTCRVRQKIYLQNDFILPMIADLVSGGNVGHISGSYLVPVYSSAETSTWMDYKFFDPFPRTIEIAPFNIEIPPLAGVTIDTAINLNWPPVPIQVFLSPIIGFARYEVESVSEVRETIHISASLVLQSCTNRGLCLLADCCGNFIEPYFPYTIDVPLDILAGLNFNGQIVRGEQADTWIKGGGNFGISATRGTGPLLLDPRNR